VAAVPASVNKQYWSVLFDQLIAQQSLPRMSFQLDRCQQLDSVTAYHSRHRHYIRVLQLINTFKVALKTLYLFDCL